MFDHEKPISDWRQQMLAAGIKAPVPLDELEIHLREEIERQVKSGLNVQQAFTISVRRIGRPAILNGEFNKNESTPMKKIGLLAILIGAVISLRILTEHPDAAHLRPNEQRAQLIAGGAMVFYGLCSAFF